MSPTLIMDFNRTVSRPLPQMGYAKNIIEKKPHDVYHCFSSNSNIIRTPRGMFLSLFLILYYSS